MNYLQGRNCLLGPSPLPQATEASHFNMSGLHAVWISGEEVSSKLGVTETDAALPYTASV